MMSFFQKWIIVCFSVSLILTNLYSQSDTSLKSCIPEDTTQRDVVDIYRSLIKSNSKRKSDTVCKQKGILHLSILPAFGYTLQTSFIGSVVGNGAFYTDDCKDANISSVLMSVNYTQKQQFLLPLHSNIWTSANRFNFLGDWYYYNYPQYTYGLGGNSSVANPDLMNYSVIKIHEAFLCRISSDFLAGLGYNLDRHWNITEQGLMDGDPAYDGKSDYDRYVKVNSLPSQASASSGISLNLLYDARRNSINPSEGSFISLIIRPNVTFLGSDNNWQEYILDYRKYISLPVKSKNILSFWSYVWLTNGKVPYLDLPGTAWDPYHNLGRGYIQSRYRGTDLLYQEAEYRFALTQSGLLGGVFFANVESVTEWPGNKFVYVQPAAGLGIRIKINKYSNTNLAIDYGFGTNNSGGIFVNLGEVF